MEQRISFVTLGVQDLEKMTAWYEEVFGWKRFNKEEGVSFFRLNGIILGLFSADELADDAGITNDGSGFKRFSLSINLQSEAEVDNTMSELVSRGARITRPAEKVFWGGYRGYIADPEDNCWEFAYNPYLEI